MSNWYVVALIATMAIVTALIRSLPFLIWSGERKTPEYIIWLGNVLPYAIMSMLVVYCLRNTGFSGFEEWGPAAISVVITGTAQVWRRNSILSIVIGTVSYMVLIQLI